MRKNFGPRPLIYPMPVLIIGSYDENNIPDAMNAAWGGISDKSEISICVGENHKTTENILARGAFTVSIPGVDNIISADYVGIVSEKRYLTRLQEQDGMQLRANMSMLHFLKSFQWR